MANAVVAQWQGHDYQARLFWQNALNLLYENTCVVEVTFEADAPKSFDDIVVKYNPYLAGTALNRVPVDYHQVKFHTVSSGRFGYEDLTDPEFINAKSFTLLQRLHDAKKNAPKGARFNLVTTDKIRDGDPLSDLISSSDKSIRSDKLFDGTTDRSRMGRVRKLWKDHLEITSDEELKNILEGLRIFEGGRSLEELRSQINFLLEGRGLKACSNANTDFRYDDLIRKLKARGVYVLNKATLDQLIIDENLKEKDVTEDNVTHFSIRSFSTDIPADTANASPENTLDLTQDFEGRYLKSGLNWQNDLKPKIDNIGSKIKSLGQPIRLHLDTHASTAFLVGSIIGSKTTTRIELSQKGRIGLKVWNPEDGSKGEPLKVSVEKLNEGEECAVILAVTHNSTPQAIDYIHQNLPNVGKVINFHPAESSNQQSIKGGAHAAMLADQITANVREIDIKQSIKAQHIFAACPNTLLFYLGQQRQALGKCIVYEFDFDRQGNRTYQPAYTIE